MKNVDIQNIVGRIKDKEGRNPFIAIASLITFPKTIPLNIILSFMFSIGVYIIGLIVLSYLNAGWIIITIIALITVLPAIVFFILSFQKLTTTDLLNNIKDVLLSVVPPIQELYTTLDEGQKENLSRGQFTLKVINEVVIPNFISLIPFLPFRKKFIKSINKAIDKLGKVNKETVVEESSELSSTLWFENIEKNIDRSISVLSKPFTVTLYLYFGFWFLLWLFFLLKFLG